VANAESISGNWGRLLERFVLVTLVCLGGMSIVSASWARDLATPRVTLLGANRGISAFVTTGSARVLILGGTDPTTLANAFSDARHPGLDRLDLIIVSGNAAGADLATRTITLLQPRMVLVVGGTASLDSAGIQSGKVIDHTTVIELPEGVSITIEVWPAANGENDDVTWSAMIERGGATVYWVSDREALMQDELPEEANVTVIGRGKPAATTPFPISRVIVSAGESIGGPDLRSVALATLGPGTETVRVFAGDLTRIELDPARIRSVDGATLAATPEAA
jgi:hypothetical protein